MRSTRSGEAMFDAKGEPSAQWKDLERLLAEYEADLERSREMCAILADYGLLEPFTMQASFQAKGETPMQITGMHRVNEKKPGEPERGAAEEPDAQGHPAAHLHAPAVARELRPPARAQEGSGRTVQPMT